MTPEKWDGKSRKMLVWCDGSPEPSKFIVIGYDPTEKGWIDTETLGWWAHCADIPEEEPKYDFVETILKTTQEQNGCITIPKRAVEQMRELEKTCGIVYEENKELKAKNESLRIEREEMAKNISADLLFELTERSINAKPYDGIIDSYGELHKIAEFVQNKILDYVTYDLSKTIKYEPSTFDRIEELPTNKVRKMTNKELAEWLAKGNGQFKNGNFGSIKTVLVYTPKEENTMVNNTCLIRAWGEDTWHEPMIEE